MTHQIQRGTSKGRKPAGVVPRDLTVIPPNGDQSALDHRAHGTPFLESQFVQRGCNRTGASIVRRLPTPPRRPLLTPFDRLSFYPGFRVRNVDQCEDCPSGRITCCPVKCNTPKPPKPISELYAGKLAQKRRSVYPAHGCAVARPRPRYSPCIARIFSSTGAPGSTGRILEAFPSLVEISR